MELIKGRMANRNTEVIKLFAITISFSKSEISLNVFTKIMTKKLNIYLNLHLTSFYLSFTVSSHSLKCPKLECTQPHKLLNGRLVGSLVVEHLSNVHAQINPGLQR